jgi:diguanylate cyclase (GGDEF)-like protein/PAS domain S-box-containing protein
MNNNLFEQLKIVRFYCWLVLLIGWQPVAWGLENPHVLLLNSYHYGLDWTDAETAGIHDVLKNSGRDIELHVEYMDTKRVADETHFNNLRQLLEYKYRNTHLSAILATDNDAFNFLKKHRNIPIFKDVPVIFAGVNYFNPQALAGYTGFTGVAETFESGQTIGVMRRLHPDARRIVVIIDATITGEAIRKEMQPSLLPYMPQITFEFWDKLSLAQIQTRLPTLDKNTLVLLMPFARDSAGTFIRYADMADMVSRLSPVPVYGTYDFYMGYGIVGGRLTRGEAQGRAAAEILLRVLNGQSPDEIPVMTVPPSEFQFDARQLHRYHISPSDLPQSSQVLYQPWYDFYRKWIWLGGILIAIMLLFSVGWWRTYWLKRRSDRALRDSDEKLRGLFNAMAEGAYGVDVNGNCKFVNQSFLRILGYSHANELIGKPIHELIHHSHPDGTPYPASECKMNLAYRPNQEVHVADEVFWTKSGKAVAVEYWSEPIVVDGKMQGAIATFIDITERKRIEAKIKESLSLLNATLEATTDAILVVDLNNAWRLNNRQFIELWSIPDEIVASKDDHAALLYVLNQVEDTDGFVRKVQDLYVHPQADSFDLLKFKDGRVIERFSMPQYINGEVVGRVWCFRDVTERKKMEEKVHQLAYYDALTMLPNRRMLMDRLALVIATSQRTHLYNALMFLDLDNFKPLNDTYGHVVGDLLLIEVANRLKENVRETDTVARFGGDEFVVILNALGADKSAATQHAESVAAKIHAHLSTPYHLTAMSHNLTDKQIEHRCGASIGVVVFGNHKGSVDDILKWADAAMYQAKQEGRNQIRFLPPSPLSLSATL